MLDNAGITNTTIQLEIVSVFERLRAKFDVVVLEYHSQRVVFTLLFVWNLARRSHGPEVTGNTESKPFDGVPIPCWRTYERLALCTSPYNRIDPRPPVYGNSSFNPGIYATVAMLFLFQGSYSIGWTPLLYLYPPEVMNYSIRANGMGIFQFALNATA